MPEVGLPWPQTDINYLAVLVAGIVGMVIGALWYSPVLFGSVWMRAMGKTKESMQAEMQGKSMGKLYVIAFVAQLITAWILAKFIYYTGAATMAEGFKIGFLLWLGFVATATISAVLWEGKKWSLYWIFNSMQLVVLLVMAWILAVWN